MASHNDVKYGSYAMVGFLFVCWVVAFISEPGWTALVTVVIYFFAAFLMSSGKGDRDYRDN